MGIIAQGRVYWKLNETKTEALKHIIDNHMGHATHSWEQRSPLHIIQSHVLCDHWDLAVKCMQYNPDLLVEGKFYNLPLLVFLPAKQKPDIISSYIIDNFSRIQKMKYGQTFFHELIKNNWAATVKELYEKYPSIKAYLFKGNHLYMGVNYIMYDMYEYSFHDLIEYLISAHAEQLTSANDIMAMLLRTSHNQKSCNKMMRLLLELPAADPYVLKGIV